MDAQYFINKFEAIPEEKWCIGEFKDEKGAKCANGHCGVTQLHPFYLTRESRALQRVFANVIVHYPSGKPLKDNFYPDGLRYSNIAAAINNCSTVEYQQSTPKQRILAALRDIQTTEEANNAVEAAKEILSAPKVGVTQVGKVVSSTMEFVITGIAVVMQTISAVLLIT